MERPELSLGDPVAVDEPGIDTWVGTTRGVKPKRSTKTTGALTWFIDVMRPDGMCFVVPAAYVTRVAIEVSPEAVA